MTDPLYHHTIIVRDRSGSMNTILTGVTAGLRELMQSESREHTGDGKKLTVSLWDFDTEITRVHAFATAAEVAECPLVPRGGTALHDATGDAVEQEGADLAAMPEGERPSTVTCVVVTDGLNNSSTRRKKSEVAEMLRVQQDVYKWLVVYLGANQDAVEEGAALGVDQDQSMTYAASSAGIASAMASAGELSVSYARGQDASFTPGMRKRAKSS